ncbi:response regulator [bacterium]|nr:response regulator [bacterium]MCB2201649.1 response regulator [bacterium]
MSTTHLSPRIENMAQSSQTLQRACHTRQGEKLRSVIAQIDTLSQLLQKMYQADFVAIFYHNEVHRVMLPVAYQHWENRELTGLDQLEARWLRSAADMGTLERLEYPLSGENTDAFAEANRFRRCLQYPIYDDGRLRGVVLVYWVAEQSNESEQPAFLMKSLMQVLLGSISVLEQTQSMDSFLMRLSAMIRLFETPLAGIRIPEALTTILTSAQQALPRCAVALVTRTRDDNTYRIKQVTGPIDVPDWLRTKLAEVTGELLDDIHANKIPLRNWYDVEIEYAREFERFVTLELTPEDKYRSALVFCARSHQDLSDVDLELISVFRVFAQVLLMNAVLVKDLTKTNALIRESTDKLVGVESVAALADMTSGVAHRLNNVIGGIIGRLQLMQVRATDEKLGEQLGQVEEMAMEGARTVKRIQEFAICARGGALEPISLSSILKKYRDIESHDWSDLARGKKIALRFEIPDHRAVVDGAGDEIMVMLTRLIENAVEFAPEQSVVTVALAIDDHEYRLSVSDKGPGIPDMIRKKVFLPFFSTKQDRDAGMGLAIAHSIATRHGGTLTFESSPEHNTTFTVSFPGAASVEDTGKIVQDNRPDQPLRVLVVDDDKQLREVLEDMLQLDGHNVSLAADGPSALEKIHRQTFDVLITDLGMPGMSGLDLAGFAHEAQPELRIAMITGWGTQLNSEEVALRGIRTVLAKPFHLKDIRHLIADLTS